MEISVQETPNPNARKYTLPVSCFTAPRNFSSEESAADEPLASRLFGLGEIYNVFWVQDFVTINKYPDAAWEPLNERVLTVLQDHLEMKA